MKHQLLLKDLQMAVRQLDTALAGKTQDDVTKAGCIQYFEFCFELTWKTIKVMAENAGLLEIVSPKAALKSAFRLKWIDNEKIWLAMLEDRNRMSHTYDSKNALRVFKNLKKYLPEFKKLIKHLTESVR